jgi:hypothetical protein
VAPIRTSHLIYLDALACSCCRCIGHVLSVNSSNAWNLMESGTVRVYACYVDACHVLEFGETIQRRGTPLVRVERRDTVCQAAHSSLRWLRIRTHMYKHVHIYIDMYGCLQCTGHVESNTALRMSECRKPLISSSRRSRSGRILLSQHATDIE